MPPCMTGSRRTPATAPAVAERSIAARQPNALLLAMRAGILAGVLALPAMAQATVIEFSVSGIVAQGVDELRLFTNYGESLVGKAYTMKFLLDTSTLTESQSGNIHGASNSGTGPPYIFPARSRWATAATTGPWIPKATPACFCCRQVTS